MASVQEEVVTCVTGPCNPIRTVVYQCVSSGKPLIQKIQQQNIEENITEQNSSEMPYRFPALITKLITKIEMIGFSGWRGCARDIWL